MRTRLIASLVSLALASTHTACAQEALWFTPSQPTVVTTEPTPEEQSFAERFGGLLSRPKTQSPISKPLINNASKAPDAAHPGAVSPASGQRSGGVREFEIPWSLTATAAFDFDQHAAKSKGNKTTASVKGHGAQVSPMAAQVRPNFVPAPTVTAAAPVARPAAQRAVLPTTDAVADTVPWEKNAREPNKAPATANESLIVRVPEAKLDQAIIGQVPGVVSKAPRPVLPTLTPGSGRLASSPIRLAAPNKYVVIDDQPSASDQAGSAVVPAPPITERLTDQAAEAKTLTQDTAQQSASAETPLLTTESMIGPLKGAEELFHRLGQENDMRHAADLIESGPRGDASNYAWLPAAYTWISPALYHHPLYFEQPNLERYGIGHKPLIQPLASSIHFFGSIPLVPYKTLTHHPRERVYTLGNMRPGNCVPVQRGVILGQSTVGEVVMFWEECSGY